VFVFRSSRAMTWLKKSIAIVVFAQIVYLLVINVALQLPITQTLINKIRPDKFHVSWESAWSWYPFRVHATGISANGQARSQQWQLDTPAASASIAVTPLLIKRVWVRDVVAENIAYRQRPRLKADKDYTDIIEFFPSIEGRDITGAVTTPRKNKRPWHIEVNSVKARGSHSFWVYQAKGSADGELHADLSYITRGGPFSLTGHELNLNLNPLYLNGQTEVFKHGTITGRVDFAPFIPRENKGLPLLKFLSLDTQVDIETNSLAFVSLFTGDFKDISVNGRGRVQGVLRYHQGQVLPGTDVAVMAPDLRLDIYAHRIEGNGEIALRLDSDTNDQLDLAFRYQDLAVAHRDDGDVLLRGQDLNVSIGGDGRVPGDPDKINESRSIAFAVDGLELPNLARLQRYLPPKWPITLYGGSGRLGGTAALKPTTLQVDLSLKSEQADLGLEQYRFDTDLDVVLKLDNPELAVRGTSARGSHLNLTDARLRRADGDAGESEAWNASLIVDASEFTVLSGQDKATGDKAADLLQTLAETPYRELLGNTSAAMGFHGDISSLAWLGVLMGDAYHIGVRGRGAFEGIVNLADGWPAKGTHVALSSDGMAVTVLDYVSTGDGRVDLMAEQGGQNPDWAVDIALSNADLKRLQESEAAIEDVDLRLAARVEDFSFQEEARPFTLQLDLTSAKVKDMSVFNGYLPPDGSLRFTRGTAQLAADIALQQDDADGWVKLESTGVNALVGGQSVSGDLTADLLLVNGVPVDMAFDITGSELRLANVRVIGDDAQFDGAYWSSTIKLTRAETVLKTPPRLDIDAELNMSDSRPIVALLDNQGWRPKFLSNMLTVEDIGGTASLRMSNDELRIFQARVLSDKIEAAIKGTLGKDNRDAMVYLRYKQADGLIKLRDDSWNLDILKVREKFDAYRVAP